VRALLDLMRENEAAVQSMAALCQQVLEESSSTLKILDPEVGDKELIKEVAVEALKLRS
jgi:hypothetical protein